jgi:hypothetical protein
MRPVSKIWLNSSVISAPAKTTEIIACFVMKYIVLVCVCVCVCICMYLCMYVCQCPTEHLLTIWLAMNALSLEVNYIFLSLGRYEYELIVRTVILSGDFSWNKQLLQMSTFTWDNNEILIWNFNEYLSTFSPLRFKQTPTRSMYH